MTEAAEQGPVGVVVLGYALTSQGLLKRAQAAVERALEAGDGAAVEDSAAAIASETETASAAVNRLRVALATAAGLSSTIVLVGDREYHMDRDHAVAAILLDIRAARRLIDELAMLRASLGPAAGRA